MVFEHRKTGRPALWITAHDPSWMNQDDPNLRRIRRMEDLPMTEDAAHIYAVLPIPPEIWKDQGRSGLYAYLKAFFYDNCKGVRELAQAKENANDFWFMFLPSGFPDGKIEIPQ